MALSTTELAADLAEMVADLPATLVWGNQSVSGTASQVAREDRVESEDVFLEADLEWHGALSGFTNSTPPGVGDSVSVGGVSYRVDRREVAQDAVGVRLFLKRD